MNTLAKIALGTVATGAVALAAVSPAMAAPQTPAVDMSVATPTTVSAPAPAYLASNSTTQASAPQLIGHHNPAKFGCGIFTACGPDHLNDF